LLIIVGFTRVLRAGLRKGDRAQMAIIGLYLSSFWFPSLSLTHYVRFLEYLSETRNRVNPQTKSTSQSVSQTNEKKSSQK
jgi:hypothetical protein